MLLAAAGISIVLTLAALRLPFPYPARAAFDANPSMAPDTTAAVSVPYTLVLSQVASGLISPVYLTHAGDGSGRLFVVEQQGRIRVIRNGVVQGTPYLDITGPVLCCGERGLLSAAFDPDYETNGAFYVNYTSDAGGGDTVIARYQVADPSADVATVLSVTQLLVIDQPQSNHNGGQIQFGVSDDYLYIGMGDGGSGGDVGSGHHEPGGNAQWPGTLLGKMLRIHVRGVPSYTIPASNPFTQTAGYRPEIWALGLRNPWRFSLDRASGDMFIGDVGQNCYEEVSYQPAGVGGLNFGWRIMEGFQAFNVDDFGDCGGAPITPVTLTLPIAAYDRSLGSAVTGGYVYRGSDYPWLNGIYFYADHGSGRIWSLEQVSPGVWASVQKRDESFSISSFGEDESGELYVLGYSNGRVYKLTSTAPPELSASHKSASAGAPASGETLSYSIVLRNAGGAFTHTLRLTDVVPSGLNYVPGSLAATLGTPDASSAPTLKWSGVMSSTTAVTITFGVTVTEVLTKPITNVAAIDPGYGAPFTRTATVVVNGMRTYLPLVLRAYP
jgi:uncharacterized repeat protein (TIGR01451 family)